MLDRNDIRAILEHTQMNAPTKDQIELLRGQIARQLITYEGMRGTLRVSKSNRHGVRLKSYYFKDREGVTFNEDGFVGFAGWADYTNVQPILRAVVLWVAEVTGHEHA